MTTEPFTPEKRTGNPFLDHIGVVLEERSPGYARYRIPVVAEVRGGVAGSLHGGAVCTLVDIAAIGAVASMLKPDERMAGTAEISVSFLRPAIGHTVFAEARLLKKDSVRLQPTVALVALATGWREPHERRIPGREPVSYAAGSGR